MSDDPAVETFLRQPELTDEECEARAMLTGYAYNPTIRVYGRRVLRNFNTEDMQIEYFNPVTLEVILADQGQAEFHQHGGMYYHERANRT